MASQLIAYAMGLLHESHGSASSPSYLELALVRARENAPFRYDLEGCRIWMGKW